MHRASDSTHLPRTMDGVPAGTAMVAFVGSILGHDPASLQQPSSAPPIRTTGLLGTIPRPFCVWRGRSRVPCGPSKGSTAGGARSEVPFQCHCVQGTACEKSRLVVRCQNLSRTLPLCLSHSSRPWLKSPTPLSGVQPLDRLSSPGALTSLSRDSWKCSRRCAYLGLMSAWRSTCT